MKKTTSVVICITTFSRIDCARINMEIIKLNYQKKWPIVHACSNKSWDKYLEDVLVKREPRKIQDGALDLLIHSLVKANQKFHPEFFIHIEGDTWLMNQVILEKYIKILKNDPIKFIAASRWNHDRTLAWKKSKKFKYYLSKVTKLLGFNFHITHNNTLSSQFFIIRNDPKIFEGLKSLINLQSATSLEEKLFKLFKNNFGISSILYLKEREPTHPNYRNLCKALELYCQHSASDKFKVLQQYPFLKKGMYMKKLIKANNYDYYNLGARID